MATADNLLELFNADFGALSIGDEAKVRPRHRPANPKLTGCHTDPWQCRQLAGDPRYLELPSRAPYQVRQNRLANPSHLTSVPHSTVISTTDIAADFPAIPYPSHLAAVAGFLAIPLSENGRDFIFFCRRSQLTVSDVAALWIVVADQLSQSIKWAVSHALLISLRFTEPSRDRKSVV